METSLFIDLHGSLKRAFGRFAEARKIEVSRFAERIHIRVDGITSVALSPADAAALRDALAGLLHPPMPEKCEQCGSTQLTTQSREETILCEECDHEQPFDCGCEHNCDCVDVDREFKEGRL